MHESAAFAARRMTRGSPRTHDRSPRPPHARMARDDPGRRHRDGHATASGDADAVVTSVQKFYAGIKQVTAQFRQTVTNETFGTRRPATARSGS